MITEFESSPESIKTCMIQNKLKLNHDKTEALMVGFAASKFVTPTQFIARATYYVKLDVLPTLFVIRRDLPRQIVLRGTLSARFKTTICHSFALTTIISFHSVPPPFFICVSPPSPRILFLPPPLPRQRGTANAEIKVSSDKNPEL